MMKNAFSDKEKKIIGILCCLEMEERHNTAFINQVMPTHIYDLRGNRLCSIRTWKRVSSGMISLNDDLYDFLLESTNNRFVLDNKLEREIKVLLIRLLEAVEADEEEMIGSQCNQLIERLSNHLDSFYYRECYLAMVDIYKLYVQDENLIQEKYDRYHKTMAIFPLHLQILIQYMMFQFAALFLADVSAIKKVVEEYQFEHSKYDFLKIKYAIHLMYQNELLASYELFGELQAKYANTTQYARYLEICNHKANLANIIQIDALDELERIISDVLDKHSNQISNRYLSNIFYIHAMRKFSRKCFSEAHRCLVQAQQLGNKRREREINIFLIYSAKQIDLPMPLETFDATLCYVDNSSTTMFYHYFVHKKNGASSSFLEGYIMNLICPTLLSSDALYFTVFEEELIELIGVSRKHKKLMLYRKRFAEITQNLL